MIWLDKLEKHFGRLAVPNLTFWIIMGQVLFYGLGLFTSFPVEVLTLRPAEVLNGQVWRLVTFIFVPDTRVISVWMIFKWYMLYLYGSALEGYWGEFRFNLFVWIGVVATGCMAILGLFVAGYNFEVPNTILLASLLLAFAALNPEFEILLFFFPVKMKWVGWFTWAMFALTLLTGPIPLKLIVVSAVVNLVLFFGKDVFGSFKARQRRKSYEKKRAAEEAEPFHTCAVCGLTDKDDPDMDFVYEDGKGYCSKHVPE